jgi:hypothetical protein
VCVAAAAAVSLLCTQKRFVCIFVCNVDLRQ